MKATESYVGQTVTEIEGKITNAGSRTVKHADVYCVFYNAYGEVVLRERVPIVATGLKPGETRAFRLPFDDIPGRLEQSDAAIGDRPHRVRLMARILVVEDDPSQFEIRKQILEHAGHEVVTAQDASRSAGALARLSAIVVMDLRIPEPEDGLRLIQAIAGKARIIVLSGGQVDPDLPVDEFLTKPAHPEGCWRASRNGHPSQSNSEKFEDRTGRLFAGWNLEDQSGGGARKRQSQPGAGGIPGRTLRSGEEPGSHLSRGNVATQTDSRGR